MLIASLIIAATIAVVMGIYFAARLVLGTEPEDKTRDLAGSVLFRIAALHGLVLALVFASEVVEYQALATESAQEANAVADIYYDAARYGPEADAVQAAMRDYLQVVAQTEWSALAETGTLSGAAWSNWETAYETVLDLVPQTPRQVALRDHMLRKLHLVSESRDMRAHHAKTTLGSVFWSAAGVGVILIAVGYYVFPPSRDNLILIAVFAGYTGLILYTIYAMSNPYSDPGGLDPVMFRDLAEIVTSSSG